MSVQTVSVDRKLLSIVQQCEEVFDGSFPKKPAAFVIGMLKDCFDNYDEKDVRENPDLAMMYICIFSTFWLNSVEDVRLPLSLQHTLLQLRNERDKGGG